MGNHDRIRFTSLASRAVAFGAALALAVPAPFARAGDPLDAPVVGQGDTAPKMPEVGRICEVLRNAKDGKFVDKDGKTSLTITNPACAGKSRRERNAAGATGTDTSGQNVSCQQTVDSLTAGMSPEKRGEEIDKLCKAASGTLNQEAATYCTLRAVAQTGQATEYCEAYESANRSSDRLIAMLALDGAAAGICWGEYLNLKSLWSTGTAESISAAASRRGMCSNAAMGAALAEIVHTIIAYTGADNHTSGEYKIDSDGNAHRKDDAKANIGKILDIIATSSMSLALIRNSLCQNSYAKAGGVAENAGAEGWISKIFPKKQDAQKFCSFLNKKLAKEGEAQKTAGAAVGKAAGEAAAKDKAKDQAVRQAEADLERLEKQDPCKFVKERDDLLGAKAELAKFGDTYAGGLDGKCRKEETMAWQAEVDKARTAVQAAKAALVATDSTAKASDEAMNNAVIAAEKARGLEKVSRKKAAQTQLQPRLDLIKSSAMILTGLAAMRGVSLVAAGSTKKKSKEILQSMFDPNGAGAPLGMSGLGSVQQNIYAATGGGTYAPPGAQPIRASAVTSGTPEAFLLPPGSDMAGASERLANQIPRARVEEAAAGGAGGVGGLVSAAATAAGAKGGLSEIRSVTDSMFAAFSKEMGGGYSGGGGRGLASTGGKEGGDLNLKSLFGGGEGGGGAEAAAPELAYREPANDDIWHSQNPKGHNLFQIVSDKYDTVQRKSAVGSEL